MGGTLSPTAERKGNTREEGITVVVVFEFGVMGNDGIAGGLSVGERGRSKVVRGSLGIIVNCL